MKNTDHKENDNNADTGAKHSASAVPPTAADNAYHCVPVPQAEVAPARSRLHNVFIIIAAVFTTVFAAWFAHTIVSRQFAVSEFKREQETLNELKTFDLNCERERFVDDADAFKCEQETLNAIASARRLREINPDYVGWLFIEGTNVDYPVVRGADNDKYLNTTFHGSTNALGTLFMDYRINGDAPHIIIYGHDAMHWIDGYLMFGGLKNYIKDEYLTKHPTITWLENDTLFEYEIFSARLTNVNDPAYFLDFSAPDSFREFLIRNNAPQDARRIMTLSTCFGQFPAMRVIVQAALKQAVPITP